MQKQQSNADNKTKVTIKVRSIATFEKTVTIEVTKGNKKTACECCQPRKR